MKKPTKSKLKKKADAIFSTYIRTRDSDGYVETNEGLSILAGKCCTCPKRNAISRMDNGHFITRACLPLRYDEQNAALQCKNCNGFHSGEQYKFGKYIVDRWGSEELDRLLEMEAEWKKEPSQFKMRLSDYQDIIDTYKRKLEELNV